MVAVRLAVHRITPAYAGKREQAIISKGFVQDHPRIRGEKLEPVPFCPCVEGSPPHTRGKVHPGGQLLQYHRITPAYAGKSPGATPPGGWCGDHPRIRGEKSRRNPAGWVVWGSPPHTRGKVYVKIKMPANTRITPAYAGKREFDHCMDSDR